MTTSDKRLDSDLVEDDTNAEEWNTYESSHPVDDLNPVTVERVHKIPGFEYFRMKTRKVENKDEHKKLKKDLILHIWNNKNYLKNE